MKGLSVFCLVSAVLLALAVILEIKPEESLMLLEALGGFALLMLSIDLEVMKSLIFWKDMLPSQAVILLAQAATMGGTFWLVAYLRKVFRRHKQKWLDQEF